MDGRTYRFTPDMSKPMAEKIEMPEHLDVSVSSKCFGKCSYCYTAAKETGHNYRDILGKINTIFGSMPEMARPFAIAASGEAEPTLHPEFPEALELFSRLKITPNYTTNGMHLTDQLLEATKKYSGGVAVSLHPHLKKYWTRAIESYSEADIRLNTHVIISSRQTIDWFWKLFDKYREKVEYFVLLPYMSNREAPYKDVDTAHLEKTLDARMGDLEQVAFGSNLHQFLVGTGNRYGASLYEPESVSGYLILDDPIRFLKDSHGIKPLPDHKMHDYINQYTLTLPTFRG